MQKGRRGRPAKGDGGGAPEMCVWVCMPPDMAEQIRQQMERGLGLTFATSARDLMDDGGGDSDELPPQ